MVSGGYPQSVWYIRFHEVWKKITSECQTFVFQILTFLTAATKSPEYLSIRRKFCVWNQSSSQVDNSQTMTYLDKWRKDTLTCCCWNRSWNRDCYLYSQMIFPRHHCCFQYSMNPASFKAGSTSLSSVQTTNKGVRTEWSVLSKSENMLQSLLLMLSCCCQLHLSKLSVCKQSPQKCKNQPHHSRLVASVDVNLVYI